MKQITSEDFTDEVLQSPKPVLVDFYTDGCGPCRNVAAVIEEIESASNGAIKMVKVDAATEAQLAVSFRVTVVPTFILFRGGERIGQFTGARTKREIERWLDDALRQQ
jgi:thioredoxin 1